MFISSDIVMFINKIINCEKDSEEIRENIVTFKDYLVLTKMADDETIKKVELIIESFDSIIALKDTFGYIDISNILKNATNKKGEAKKPFVYKKAPVPQVVEKHYHHYVENYSSGCGSSSSVSRSSC